MMGDVKTNLLLEGVHAEHSQNVEKVKVRDHDDGDPANNPEDAANLGEEETSIRRSISPHVEPTVLSVLCAVRQINAGLFGEESDGDASPDTITQVNGNGINSIVNLELDEEVGPEDVSPSSNDTDHECRPGFDHGASRGNTHEARERSIHTHGNVVGRLARLSAVHDHVSEHGRNRSTGSSNGGRDGTKGGNVATGLAGNHESGTGVESVPSHPEDEGTEDLEGDAMGGEVMRLGELIAIGVVEASDTRAEDLGGEEGGDSARHVNDSGTGKVVHSTAKGRVVIEGREETARTPDGVHDDGVYEPGEHEGVAQVGFELAPFGNRTGDDGSGRGRKGELEEPPDQLSTGGHVGEEESLISNETLLGGIGTTVRKGVPDRPKAEGTTASIEDVLEHDILDILLTDGSGAKHGEASLHEEHHGGGEEEVKDIETRVRLISVGEGSAYSGLDGIGCVSLSLCIAEGCAVEGFCGGHGLRECVFDSCLNLMNGIIELVLDINL
mmetsp:Transcript_8249/g.18488  ORF Transcript_8249/g.18488 Transcript_8249/m.18488 type:complete len:499 (-) Transcript_8249:108-1604(-)